ncbi:MAG: hypothetical protein IM550_06375 [Microcystis sp. M54BS1]|nr:hypothetical protein [Microcystis sp. M54BS1]
MVKISAAQKIQPEGGILVSRSANKIIATQKGYFGGRIVKVEVELLPSKASNRAIKTQMKKALAIANFLVSDPETRNKQVTSLHVTQTGEVEQRFKSTPPITVDLAKRSKKIPHQAFQKNIVELTLRFEGKSSLHPPTAAAQHDQLNTLHKILFIIKRFLKSIEAPELKSPKRSARLALSAEHLSSGSYSNLVVHIVQKVIGSEKASLKLAPGAPRNFFEAYRQYDKAKAPETAHYVNKNLEKLDVNECLLFSMRIPGHAMSGMVIKQPDGNLTYFHSNTGAGIRNHYSKKNARGEVLFQQVYVIQNIPPKQFQQFMKDFTHKKVEFTSKKIDESTAWVYKKLSTLGPSKFVDNPRFWSTAQVGGSCTGGAEKAILKAVLTKKSFQTLQTHLQVHNVFKMYKKLIDKDDSSYHNKVGILEIVKILQAKQLNQEMRDALDTVRIETEKRLNKKEEIELSQSFKSKIYKEFAQIDPNTKNPEDILKHLCFLFASGDYPKAGQLIASFRKFPPSSKPTPQEIAAAGMLVKLYNADIYHTREMINLYYHLSQLLIQRGHSSKLTKKMIHQATSEYFRGKIQKYYPPDLFTP